MSKEGAPGGISLPSTTGLPGTVTLHATFLLGFISSPALLKAVLKSSQHWPSSHGPLHTVRSSAYVKFCASRAGASPWVLLSTGPLFDEIPKDWRHSIFLTGRATAKEFLFASVSPENQRLLLADMAREWKKGEEHKATLPLTQGELRKLWSRFPELTIVGTRWFLTRKDHDCKARLVVQGREQTHRQAIVTWPLSLQVPRSTSCKILSRVP